MHAATGHGSVGGRAENALASRLSATFQQRDAVGRDGATSLRRRVDLAHSALASAVSETRTPTASWATLRYNATAVDTSSGSRRDVQPLGAHGEGAPAW